MSSLVILSTLLTYVTVYEEEYDFEYCTNFDWPEGSAPGKEFLSCTSSHAVCKGHHEGVQKWGRLLFILILWIEGQIVVSSQC